jgi:hypothetical protein
MNNTYILEKKFDWKDIVAEPRRQELNRNAALWCQKKYGIWL